MKHFLLIVSVFVFYSCLDSEEKTNMANQNHKPLPEVNKQTVRFLSYIDASRFPNTACDTIDNIDFNNLPIIEGDDRTKEFFYKYVCNRTFCDNFNTYILSSYEGGDYGPLTFLCTCIQDTILAIKKLYQIGDYENDYKHKYSTVFLSDSTFVVTKKSQIRKMDSLGMSDSLCHYLKIESYEIARNGGFRLLNETLEEWSTYP